VYYIVTIHQSFSLQIRWKDNMASENEVLERKIPGFILLEQELHKLYSNLSEKVEDVAIKALFTYIAADSLKHSIILTRIVKEFGGSKVKEKDFDINIKYSKNLIATLSKDISKSRKINSDELTSLSDTLIGFESLLVDEYSKAFRVRESKSSTHWRNAKNQQEMDILSLIVDDEERHQEILLWIVSSGNKTLNFKNDLPIPLYQNPDAW
jgi:hypothetical protein